MLSQRALSIQRRMKIVAVLSLLIIAVLILRAYDLQILNGEAHYLKAKSQTVASITMEPERGRLLDRHQVPIAVTVKADSLFARPQSMTPEHRKEAAEKLSVLYPSQAAQFQRLLNGRSVFVFLKRKLSATDMQEMQAFNILQIPGLGLTKEMDRYYSMEDSFAASTLGYVDMDGNGRLGVEKIFDNILKGEAIEIKGIRDANRNIGYGISSYVPGEAVGHSLVLCLDNVIQRIADRAIAAAVERTEAKQGVVVVMEPSTGDVLAISQYPTFDPNHYSSFPASRLHNLAIEYPFEPGSTMKVVTIGAALDLNLVKPTTVYHLGRGSIHIGGYTISDSHHYNADTSMTVEDILVKSSNIGALLVGQTLGAKNLHGALSAFGFGKRTSIALPYESPGILRDYRKWMPVDTANISFGQGVSVTVMQVAQMTAAIANDGVLLRPRLIKGVVTPDNEFIPADTIDEAPVRAMRAETAQLMRRMMSSVVGAGGTARKAAIEGFAVAGKTGTAQKFDTTIKKYSKKLWTSWFLGMVPAEKPRLVAVVMIDEPGGKFYYGGDVAAPAFKDIVQETLRQWGELAVAPQQKDVAVP